MNRTLVNVTALLATAAKALLLAAAVCAPLLAAGTVHAQSDSVLVGWDQGGSGAGFVLLVSLQRNA